VLQNKKSAEHADPTLREKEINNKNFTTRFKPMQTMKEDFCFGCGFSRFFPSSFFDPGDAQCPGGFDPDSNWCPRHKEWEEELREEEYYEAIETYTQKF
jgi:hypothetical protein